MQENKLQTNNLDRLISKGPERLRDHHFHYACLGGVAGFFMESCLYPIDTVRTRMKANTQESVALLNQFKNMHKNEGLYSFFRGYSCVLAGSFAGNSAYFYVYEKLKHMFVHHSIFSQELSPFVAAFTGGFISNWIALPFSVIKSRMQLKPGQYDYKHFFDGFKQVLAQEGPKKLYISGPAFFAQAAIETSLTFGFYELFYKVLGPMFKTEKDFNLPLSVISSVSAAGVTGLIINPLDVLVTRLQVSTTNAPGLASIPEMAKRIYNNEGFGGYMKGVSGTISLYSLGALVLFPTYEILKASFKIDISH